MGVSLQTGQHSPSGVNLSSTLHSGSKQGDSGQSHGRGRVGIHRGQHSPGGVKLMPSTHATAVQKTLLQSTGRWGPVLQKKNITVWLCTATVHIYVVTVYE